MFRPAGIDTLQFPLGMSRNPIALSWGYTDRAVELCYLCFHFIDEYCFEAAPITLTLPVRADKVWVHNPTLVLSVLDNEAAAALTTTHRGLKVVMMNPPPLTVVVGTQDGLDLVPGLIINQVLVAAGVLKPLVAHNPTVVWIVQQIDQP